LGDVLGFLYGAPIALIETLNRFMGNAPQFDDITFMILTHNDK
jgi:hypothetical protein